MTLHNWLRTEVKKATGRMQNADDRTFLFWSSRRQAMLAVLSRMEVNNVNTVNTSVIASNVEDL